MLGEAIGQRALGDAGKRALPTEQTGPRPEGVRADMAVSPPGDSRTARATKP